MALSLGVAMMLINDFNYINSNKDKKVKAFQDY